MANKAPEDQDLAVAMLWQDGQILMQERTHDSKGEIGFFGGKLKPGEEPHDGVVRKVKKETGLVLDLAKLSLLGEVNVDSRKVYAFAYRLPHEIEVVAVEGTVSKMHAYEVGESDNLSELTRTVWEEYV